MNIVLLIINEINVIKLSLPVKTIKKNHPNSDSAIVLINQDNYMEYELVENLVGQKVSVVIPSKLEYMVDTKFYGITSNCSMVI